MTDVNATVCSYEKQMLINQGREAFKHEVVTAMAIWWSAYHHIGDRQGAMVTKELLAWIIEENNTAFKGNKHELRAVQGAK
jgi:hypothetical protein